MTKQTSAQRMCVRKQWQVIVLGLMFTGMLVLPNLVVHAQIRHDIPDYQLSAGSESDATPSVSPQQRRETTVEMASRNRPRMGVFLDNLDFETAYKRHYDYTYGVLIGGIIAGGPAEEAGLMKEDIIMEVDGTQVQYEAQVERLLNAKNPGDQVTVKYFRDGQIRETELTLREPEHERKPEPESRPRFRPFAGDPGDGGFGFNATWYAPDHARISDLITGMGFADVLSDPPVEDLTDPGFMMRGFQLQFEGGDEWFWGVVRNNYNVNRRRTVSGVNSIRQLNYKFGYWGFTLDKRVNFLRLFVLDGGLLVGWGSYNIKLLETHQNPVWNNLNSQLENALNNYVELKKNYLIAQPSAAVLFNLTDWFALQGRIGYFLGYPLQNGWEAEVIGENFEVVNAPETKLRGATYSMGIWFDIF